MNLTITPAAERYMRRMIRFGGGMPGAGFRLAVSPGGCSGLHPEFTVEAAPLPGDEVIELETARVFLPEESRALLEGYTVDFADAMMEAGLKFFNPDTQGACGCGSGPSGLEPGVSTVNVSSIGRRGR